MWLVVTLLNRQVSVKTVPFLGCYMNYLLLYNCYYVKASGVRNLEVICLGGSGSRSLEFLVKLSARAASA